MILKVVLIGNDTPHRRYIINNLIRKGHNINKCIFEMRSVQSSFDTKSKWEIAGEQQLNTALSKNGCNELPEGLSISYVETLNDSNAVEQLQRLNFDCCIISGARRLSGAMLMLIEKTGVNVHMGIATEYRGLDTNLWAIYHKDFDNIGVTLHQVNEELDTGDVYEVASIPKDRIKHLHLLRLYESDLAIELLHSYLSKFNRNDVIATKQKSKGRYYSFMPALIKNKLSLKCVNP